MVSASGAVTAGVGVAYEMNLGVQLIAFRNSPVHQLCAVLIRHGDAARSARVGDLVGLQELFQHVQILVVVQCLIAGPAVWPAITTVILPVICRGQIDVNRHCLHLPFVTVRKAPG